LWLYLKTGFYSVVKKTPCKEDELMVRAHSRVDIDNLQELLKTKYKFNGKVLDTPETDYEYRMIVPRATFASFMSIAVNDLVHESFKYSKSWEAMNGWQKELRT